jgi:hypothetical protein
MKFRDNYELQAVITVIAAIVLLCFTAGCTHVPTQASADHHTIGKGKKKGTHIDLPILRYAMPDTVSFDLSHASHSTVGSMRCHSECSEDSLTVASVVLGWQGEHLYLNLSEGINLSGRNGGGFYGPGEVFQAHVGYTFKIK